jgi:hypothetical protein
MIRREREESENNFAFILQISGLDTLYVTMKPKLMLEKDQASQRVVDPLATDRLGGIIILVAGTCSSA